jgi:hypothetical protein
MTSHDPHPAAPEQGKHPAPQAHGTPSAGHDDHASHAHHTPHAHHASHAGGRLAHLLAMLRRAGVWLLALMVVVLAVWKFFGDRARDAAHAEAEARLRSAARALAIEEASSLLMMAGSFIGRQVTPAMRAGDFGAVRTIFKHAKSFDHFADLSLIRNDGKVLVATNSPLEGTSASAMFRDLTSKLDQILVDQNLKGMIRVLVPVRNHELTLGVVVIAWDATHIDAALGE